MRLSTKILEEITGRKRKSAQVLWFRQHLGADVPYDRHGPIITDIAYEKLVERRVGLIPAAANSDTRPTPQLKLLRSAK